MPGSMVAMQSSTPFTFTSTIRVQSSMRASAMGDERHDARVVDEDVDPSERAERRVRQGTHVLQGRDVRDVDPRGAPTLADARSHRFQAVSGAAP